MAQVSDLPPAMETWIVNQLRGEPSFSFSSSSSQMNIEKYILKICVLVILVSAVPVNIFLFSFSADFHSGYFCLLVCQIISYYVQGILFIQLLME